MSKSSSKQHPAAKERAEKLRQDADFVEHTWPENKLLSHFNTNLESGLTLEQVGLNKLRFGSNSMTPHVRLPPYLRFLLQFTNFFALLLLVAAALCFVAYSLDFGMKKKISTSAPSSSLSFSSQPHSPSPKNHNPMRPWMGSDACFPPGATS